MKSSAGAVLLIVVLPGAVSPAPASENFARRASLNVTLGGRNLDREAFGKGEEHVLLGLSADFGKPSWLLRFEVGLHRSLSIELLNDSYFGEVREVARLGELTAGGLKIWQWTRLRPYLGAGALAFVMSGRIEEVTFSGDVVDFDDNIGLGGYLRAGLVWEARNGPSIGLDARGAATSAFHWFGREATAGYRQVALLLRFTHREPRKD